jgi:glutaredoxin
MNKKFLPLMILGALVIIAFGVVIFPRDNSPEATSSSPFPLPTSYELFWGEGCPHCANVDDFLETWDKKDEIKVEKKEVYENKGNSTLLAQRANYCKINTYNIGIPFLFTPDGKCISGDTPIIDFFKSLE